MDLFGGDTEDGGDGRAADVDVHDTGLAGVVGGECPCELGAEGGFADAAFTAEDEDFSVDEGHAGADEGEGWVGTGGFV